MNKIVDVYIFIAIQVGGIRFKMSILLMVLSLNSVIRNNRENVEFIFYVDESKQYCCHSLDLLTNKAIKIELKYDYRLLFLLYKEGL